MNIKINFKLKNELLANFDYTKQEVKNSLKEIENIKDEYNGVFVIDTIAEWVYRNNCKNH